MIKPKSIKLCPKCGSANIGFDSGGSSPWDYCKECNFNNLREGQKGFISQFPEVKISQVKKFLEMIKTKNKKSNSNRDDKG
ncbi:MAG: hypothetical protein WC867_05015 [Candidatus Pacearchaeota archaeon]|jgi:hypothetical protein